MPVEITELNELSSLLGKIYWVESQLELSSQWEAFLTVKEQKYRDVLFRISHDSEAHKALVKRVCSDIEGIDLEKAVKGLKDKGIDFKRRHDQEIMNEVLRYEFLALDLYKKMYSHTSRDFIKKIWKGEEPEDYFKHLEWLIDQESIHIKLLKPFAGKIERIL